MTVCRPEPIRTPLQCALLGLLITTATLPLTSYAQNVTPPSADTEVRTFNLPVGPLDETLNRFAAMVGINLSYSAEQLAGLQSQGLTGGHSVNSALNTLLTGTGLEAIAQPGGGYSLRPIASETMMLPTVTVSGTAIGNATEGTGSYTQSGPSSTATGLNMSLRETPQSVTVMTRQRMDDFNLETLTDVLEQTPGVTVSRQNDSILFNVRGSAVNLQTDGNRMLASGWGWNSHIVHTLNDLAEIDRIEVLKGSSGLINGDGAYGATVNLIRKRPTHEFQASTTVGVGSWDTYRLDTDVSGPLSADASLRGRLVAAHKDSQTFNGKTSDSTMLYGTLEYDLTPNTLLGTGLTWRQHELRGAAGTTPIQGFDGNGNPVPLMSRDYNIGADWAGYKQDSLNAFTRLEHRFSNGWTGKFQVSHEDTKTPEMRIGSLRYALPTVTAQYGIYKNIESRDQNVILDLQGPFTLFEREHQLLIGAGTTRHRTTLLRGDQGLQALPGIDYSQGGSAVPKPSNPPIYSNDYFSNERSYVYAASRLSLADPVKLIVGARITDYEQKDVTDISWYNSQLKEKGVVTPYAGLVVDVTREVSIYASYTSIFNAQDAKNASGRTLDPEEGLTYEVGVKGEFFDKRLNASASYFWMKTDNTAEAAGLTPEGDTFYRAVMGATQHGYELELSGELARGWQAQGSYVLNNSDLDSASTTPEHQFKLGTTYGFSDSTAQGLTVGASTRWQSTISTRRDEAELRQNAYWLLDLMARYQINDHLSASANVNNVLDKEYFAGVADFNAQGLFYTWGEPRNLTASIRYEF